MTGSAPRPDGHRQDEILAGEYVLGVLSIEDRKMVERRVADDATFSQTVARWQTDLEYFNQDYDEVTPRAAVLEQLELKPVRSAANRPGDHRYLEFDGLLALAFARHLGGRCRSSGLRIRYRVAVSSRWHAGCRAFGTQQSRQHARVLRCGKRAHADRAGRGRSGAGEILELWLVPGQGGPFSLGILPADAGGELVIPTDMRRRLSDGATLAVTLEPFGGSPTGRPTGAIVASGTARSL